jgi:hypothetical protein
VVGIESPQMDLGFRLTGSSIQGCFPLPVIVEPPLHLTEIISSHL